MDNTARERMRRYRNRKRNIKAEGVTVRVTPVEVDEVTAAKLLLICKSCNKEIPTLSGKRENILTMIRYGIGGPTLESVYQQLEPNLR